MKKYVWFILLLFTVGCYPDIENEAFYMNETDSNSTKEWDFLDINDMIFAIESSENIEREYIGIERRKSCIYSCYEKLLKIVSDSLWIKLSYSKNPVMRYYAYNALLTRKNDNISSIRNRLIKDRESVCVHTCDMINCEILGELILFEEEPLPPPIDRAIAFIESIGLPPPREIKKSQL